MEEESEYFQEIRFRWNTIDKPQFLDNYRTLTNNSERVFDVHLNSKQKDGYMPVWKLESALKILKKCCGT